MNEVNDSLDQLGAATDRLLATIATLSDAEVREPSPLPGWTRGHVLTHIARNADGLGNLLRWAHHADPRFGWHAPPIAAVAVGHHDGSVLIKTKKEP